MLVEAWFLKMDFKPCRLFIFFLLFNTYNKKLFLNSRGEVPTQVEAQGSRCQRYILPSQRSIRAWGGIIRMACDSLVVRLGVSSSGACTEVGAIYHV